MTAPAGLEAARVAAWEAYDAAVRAQPDCEHNREWRRQVAEARRAYMAAMRACDRARKEAAR